MEGNEKPYWNEHPHQTFDTNLGYFENLFDRNGGMLHVLGLECEWRRQYYTTREVFGILCRWYGKPISYENRYGLSEYGWTGNEENLVNAFCWYRLSSDLSNALDSAIEEGTFDSYKPQPYTAYDVFRILYRLKYGEWLLPQPNKGPNKVWVDEAEEIEALDYGLDKNGRPWAIEAKYSRGSPIDGKEPSIPLKPPKKVYDGDALFSAIGRMGRK